MKKMKIYKIRKMEKGYKNFGKLNNIENGSVCQKNGKVWKS